MQEVAGEGFFPSLPLASSPQLHTPPWKAMQIMAMHEEKAACAFSAQKWGFLLSQGVTATAHSIPAPPLCTGQCSSNQSNRCQPSSSLQDADTSQEGTLEKAPHSPTQT